MLRPTYAPIQLTSELDHVYATDSGMDWIADNPSFLERVDAFVAAEQAGSASPERVFNGRPFVGAGRNSIVREYGGAAVKIATTTTGRRGSYVENLLRQFAMLDGLHTYLASQRDSGVTVPEQLLAMRTPGGNFIRVEEHMKGWETLHRRIATLGLDGAAESHINRSTAKRVKRAIGFSAVRLGLNDLGLFGGERLHSANVLVPGDADDLAETDVCIIDQPQPGFRGVIAASLLRDARRHRQSVRPAYPVIA